MKDFKDKVAAITGAGSGMGRTLALDLARQGCHLALSDINPKGLAETVRLASAHGVKVTSSELNVADREAVYQWADDVMAAHGRVNMIFNNAGVAHSGTIAEMSYDDMEWIININLWGVIYGTKAFLPYLEASGEGHVINLSSLFGLCAQPTMGSYNVTKFAVRGFTEALRQELDLAGSSVSATSVHPGGIKTNIARAGRVDSSVEQVTGKTAEEGVKEFEKFFITSPEKAASIILQAVRKNRRRVVVGPDAKLLDLIVRIFPSAYQRLIVAGFRRKMAR